MLHRLDIENDRRSLFKIETFCFAAGGVMNISVTNFIAKKQSKPLEDVRAGFVMVKTSSESQLQQFLEETMESNACILDASLFKIENLVVDMSTGVRKNAKQRVVKKGEEGLYSLVFARCFEPSENGLDETGIKVSFKLDAALLNPGPNYLSACEEMLPVLFLVFSISFTAAAVAWGYVLIKRKDQVHHIHYLMMVLICFKSLALLLDSIRYHYIAMTGSAEAWSIVFYIVTFCKSVLLFTVILLIGTGWSLVKPYLSDREKQIVLIVLILQVLDNTALVVLEEMAPGSVEWYTWRDVLHLVDIACCCAILFPIVWSIRHLRQAAGADGKAEHNLMKLTLFRQFYIMVVSYIYFTRIIVYLLAATVPYDYMWLRFLFSELATLAFYVVTGLKFRPDDENPYLPLRKNDDENDFEFGLKDNDGGDVELAEK